jgi:putative transposase
MTNHVHLPATPAATGGISCMMQAVGSRYVGSFNSRYRRTGTLWEGRFKAALVDTDSYLLTCYRYIELNPVRAHMTNDPADYPWSSYHHNAFGQYSPLIAPHEQYTALGTTPDTRQAAYRALIDEKLEEKQLADLRQHTRQQRAWGSERIKEQIEALTRRSVSVSPRGYPGNRPKLGTNKPDHFVGQSFKGALAEITECAEMRARHRSRKSMTEKNRWPPKRSSGCATS